MFFSSERLKRSDIAKEKDLFFKHHHISVTEKIPFYGYVYGL